MMNFLILFAILFVFVQFEFCLRLGRVFNRETPIALSERVLARALEIIFALLRSYRGFRLEVDDRVGDACPPRFVLVANHQSLADIPVLGFVFKPRRLRFVAKKELGDGVPLVSLILRMQGHALIRRHGDPGQALKAITRFARRCAREGTNPVIFPEGTRSRSGELMEFHSGGFRRIHAEGALPILVVALDGGHRISTVRSILANLKGVRYRVRIAAVLPPPGTKAEIVGALAQSRAIIDAAIAEMRAEPAAAF